MPWLSWMSSGARSALALNRDSVRYRRAEALSHDHLFHSVLGALQIHAGEYSQGFDAFAPCRAR